MKAEMGDKKSTYTKLPSTDLKKIYIVKIIVTLYQPIITIITISRFYNDRHADFR